MDIADELRALKDTVEAQQRQIESLTAQRTTAPDGGEVGADSTRVADADTTRRGFFTKAIVAGAAGAAGLAATAQPAAAGIGTGEEFTLGVYNQANDTTTLFRAAPSDKTGLAVSVDGAAVAASGSSPTGTGLEGSTTSGTGIVGLADGGDGAFGQTVSGRGVVGTADTGVGLSAFSESGTGAVVGSTTGVPLQITPGSTVGPPTSGFHPTGGIYLDAAGQLFICLGDGSPGFWSLVNTPPGLQLLGTPQRAYDSRPGQPGSGPKGTFGAGETRTIDLSLDADIFDSDISVLVNATVTSTTGAGYGSIYSADNETLNPPPFSSINWTSTGQTIGNNVQSRVFESQVKVYVSRATHVILDVVGYVPSALEGAAPLAKGATASARQR